MSDDLEVIDCLKEHDTQKTLDFHETEVATICGLRYYVRYGPSGLAHLEPVPEEKPYEPAEGWVSYSIQYTVSQPSPYATFVIDSVSAPEPVQVKKTKRVRLSPHAKLTREILRRPNKYGK